MLSFRNLVKSKVTKKFFVKMSLFLRIKLTLRYSLSTALSEFIVGFTEFTFHVELQSGMRLTLIRWVYCCVLIRSHTRTRPFILVKSSTSNCCWRSIADDSYPSKKHSFIYLWHALARTTEFMRSLCQSLCVYTCNKNLRICRLDLLDKSYYIIRFINNKQEFFSER